MIWKLINAPISHRVVHYSPPCGKSHEAGIKTSLEEEEIGSFEEFIKKESKTEITEEYLVSVHSRMTYVRKVEIEHPDVSLSCEYSPSTEGIKHISKGNYAINIPKLYATGFDVSTLPYCDDLK